MTPERWEQITSIFRDALRIEPRDREAFVRRACQSDADLLAEIESLLEHLHDMPTDFAAAPESPARPPRTVSPRSFVGSRIGPYLVQRLIGRGGMGEVYEAQQEKPRRMVALKTMRPGFDRGRFEKEWQIIGTLSHEGIAHVYEAGEHEGRTGTVPFFTMELVRNARHITVYADDFDLDTRDRLELVAKACDAVQAAHQKGIVHRDLKPGNILVGSQGLPKVIDFGVARAAASTVVGRTAPASGTFDYMSPEQWEGDADLDPRSDVYSLGVVLYEMLCGQRPYEISPETIRAVKPVAPGKVKPELAGGIEDIILKALKRRRDRRYRNAADLADDLRRHLKGETPLAAASRSREPPGARGRTWISRSRVVAATVTLSVVVVAGGLLVLGLNLFGPQKPPDDSDSGGQGTLAGAGATWVDPEPRLPPPRARAVVKINAEWKDLEGRLPSGARPARPDAENVLVLEPKSDRAGHFYVFFVRPDGSTVFAPEHAAGGQNDCEPIPYPSPGSKISEPFTFYLSGRPEGVNSLIVVETEERIADICERLSKALSAGKRLALGEEPVWPGDGEHDDILSKVEQAVITEDGSVLGFDVFSYPVFPPSE